MWDRPVSPPFCCLRLFVFRNVPMAVFCWGRSEGEGFYPVHKGVVFPGPVEQDLYAWLPQHFAQVHVA